MYDWGLLQAFLHCGTAVTALSKAPYPVCIQGKCKGSQVTGSSVAVSSSQILCLSCNKQDSWCLPMTNLLLSLSTPKSSFRVYYPPFFIRELRPCLASYLVSFPLKTVILLLFSVFRSELDHCQNFLDLISACSDLHLVARASSLLFTQPWLPASPLLRLLPALTGPLTTVYYKPT